jgi:signal-transduction protein with cAMP-binding, CBS, and nucleotidyltransferase domain
MTIVKKCKLKKVATCNPNSTITEVAKKLKAGENRQAIVLEKSRPIGIISSVDIINKVVALGKDSKKVKAKDVMNKVHCIRHNENVANAYFAMAKHGFLCCPVIENKKYIGNLNLHEALRYISEKTKNVKRRPRR